MSHSRSAYASYVQLSSILASQVPKSPKENLETWTAERYFIICHQVSELLASQILTDVRCAAELISRPEGRNSAQRLLTRAAACSLQFYQHSEQLMYSCPKNSFLEFRLLLGSASASESEQFSELLKITLHDHPDCVAIESAINEPNSCPVVGSAENSAKADGRNILEALSVTTAAILLWRRLHVLMATFFIDTMPGTGSTSGADYLMRRMHEGASRASGCDSDSTTFPPRPSGISMESPRSSAAALNDRVRQL